MLTFLVAVLLLVASACTPRPTVLGEETDPDDLGPGANAAAGANAPQAAARPDTTALRNALSGMVRAFEGHAGIWVADPTRRGALFASNADEKVPSASLYKLAVLVHAESLIDQKRLALSDAVEGTDLTVDEALEAMITVSDNATAEALWQMFGVEAMNATLRSQGVPGLVLSDEPDRENLATARGIGTLLTRLAQRQLVSPAASDRMLARLERTEHRDRIPAKLPEAVRVAHKTGDLDAVFHDAGIVFTKGGPRVVVVLTWDAGEAAANDLIARVARTVFDEASR